MEVVDVRSNACQWRSHDNDTCANVIREDEDHSHSGQLVPHYPLGSRRATARARMDHTKHITRLGSRYQHFRKRRPEMLMHVRHSHVDTRSAAATTASVHVNAKRVLSSRRHSVCEIKAAKGAARRVKLNVGCYTSVEAWVNLRVRHAWLQRDMTS